MAPSNRLARIEQARQKSPEVHRLKLLALAALGHFYLACLLLVTLVLAIFAATAFLAEDYVTAGVQGLLASCLGSMAFAAVRLRLPRPEGRFLIAEDAPALFSLVDKIRLRLQAPPIQRVIINDSFEARILEVPRLGIFGWSHRTLLIGLPLMQALSRKEVAATISQEYAHISRRRGRLDAWAWRAHMMWLHVGAGLPDRPTLTGRLLTGFLRWYIPRLDMLCAIQGRQDEFAADLIAADVVGHQIMADALIARALRGRFLEERFWQGLWARAAHQDSPPFLPHAAMRTALSRGLSPTEAQGWLKDMLQHEAPPGAVEPTPGERILALGGGADLPPEATHSAAQSLLGELLPNLQQDFDERWLARNASAWRLHYHAVSSARETVLRMGQRVVEQMNPEDAAHLGLALDTLGRSDEALPLLRHAAEHPNGSAEAAFAVARLLKARQDARAHEYLETARRRNPQLVAARAAELAAEGLRSHEGASLKRLAA